MKVHVTSLVITVLQKETSCVIMMLKKLLTFRIITKTVTKTSCVITHHCVEPVIFWKVIPCYNNAAKRNIPCYNDVE